VQRIAWSSHAPEGEKVHASHPRQIYAESNRRQRVVCVSCADVIGGAAAAVSQNERLTARSQQFNDEIPDVGVNDVDSHLDGLDRA